MTSQLGRLLRQSGIQQVQTRACTLEFRAGTPAGQHFAEVIWLGYRTGLPFLRKYAQIPEEYEELCQQMRHEMQQPDFVATMGVLTAWGTTLPQRGESETTFWSDRN